MNIAQHETLEFVRGELSTKSITLDYGLDMLFYVGLTEDDILSHVSEWVINGEVPELTENSNNLSIADNLIHHIRINWMRDDELLPNTPQWILDYWKDVESGDQSTRDDLIKVIDKVRLGTITPEQAHSDIATILNTTAADVETIYGNFQ